MRWRRFAATVSMLVLLPVLAAAQTLTVSAAASLRESFEALGPRFAAEHPGVTLRFNFAASGALLQQVIQGAPVDVLATADPDTLDRGAAVLLPGTRRDFIGNVLVLVTPPASEVRVLRDLALPSVRRVAVGKPASVPAGRYAQQALVHDGLWASLQPRLVLADHVRQVLDYVARGEVDAGFVYRSDAQRVADRVRVAAPVPLPTPIRYPVAVVKDSRQPALARAFVAFLASPAAQAELLRAGFAPLP